MISKHNVILTSIIKCHSQNIEKYNFTAQGIQAVTAEQRKLAKLELRVMKNITGAAFSNVKSERLNFVDISGCSKASFSFDSSTFGQYFLGQIFVKNSPTLIFFQFHQFCFLQCSNSGKIPCSILMMKTISLFFCCYEILLFFITKKHN